MEEVKLTWMPPRIHTGNNLSNHFQGSTDYEPVKSWSRSPDRDVCIDLKDHASQENKRAFTESSHSGKTGSLEKRLFEPRSQKDNFFSRGGVRYDTDVLQSKYLSFSHSIRKALSRV
ncbi:MAG: hypothetical protein DWH94_10370 [Planctomycetota bacterium]|nr:MAG: hypothetical protein DWH94_10370 [Planctomycetota bacterium]